MFLRLLYEVPMFSRFFMPPAIRVFFYLFPLLALFYSPLYAWAGGGRPENYNVAMRSFGVWEPATGERVDFSVWFPSRIISSENIREGWIVEASKRGRILPGFYPLVLVSHDTASSRFANNDLAAALASGGMIVIVPAHTNDNQNSSEGIYTAAILRDRPRHLLRALETVLGTPDFALHADESRIGLLGVGFGAITVLQLAGATPDFSRLEGYCGAASGQDAFCSSWTYEKLALLPARLKTMLARRGPVYLNPPLDFYTPPLMAVAVPEEENHTAEILETTETSRTRSLWQRFFGKKDEEDEHIETASSTSALEYESDAAQTQNTSNSAPALPSPVLDFQGGPLFGGTDSGAPFVHIALPDSPLYRMAVSEDPAAGITPEPPLVTIDPSIKAYRRVPDVRRIKGIALMAPAGGMLFSRAALSDIQVPVAVVEAGNDGLYPPQQHSYPFFTHLPVQPLLLQLQDADHFSLFARCSRDTLLNLGESCGRLVGDARQNVALRRDRFLTSFFQSALGGVLPPAPPSGYVAKQSEE